MRSSQRLALLVGAVVVLVIGFVVANSGGGGKKAAPVVRHFAVVVAAGKPVGGVKQLVANKGDTIDLTVRSNVADEIHIHGYDFHKNVAAAGSVQFSFPATIDGNFVIELESRAEQIASLTVRT
jgi:uncharacterized protein YfiM (DUF2279 family)